MRSPTSAPARTSESQWSPSTTRDAATLAAIASTGTATRREGESDDAADGEGVERVARGE